MKYYVHKETGEPMAAFGELFDLVNGDASKEYPYLSQRDGCVQRVVFPKRWMGNGILFEVMHYKNLKKFKRIKREDFFKICPDFGQLRHFGDKTIDFNKHRSLFEGIKKRDETFGK